MGKDVRQMLRAARSALRFARLLDHRATYRAIALALWVVLVLVFLALNGFRVW